MYWIGYEVWYFYFGVICGRVVNRIVGGIFSLDGKEYKFLVNNGLNYLYGGVKGFDKVLYVDIIEV